MKQGLRDEQAEEVNKDDQEVGLDHISRSLRLYTWEEGRASLFESVKDKKTLS